MKELKNTYWNNKGKYKRYNSILWKKYIPISGVNLTGNNSADNAIMKYRNSSKKYRRFYNDGDPVREAGVSWNLDNGDDYSPDVAKRLELWMDRIILETWIATKKATIKVKLKGYSGSEGLY